MEKELVVKKSVIINAAPSKVWDAITNPDLTKKYMYNSEVVSDWTTGSSIIWRDAGNKGVHVRGIIVGIQSEKYLETLDLSIDSDMADIESNYSRVRYELKKDNNKTLLYLTEKNFNGDKKRYEDADKFWTIVIKRMKELLEK